MHEFPLIRTYIGDYLGEKEHGVGMYEVHDTGQKYAGQFNENKAEGIGVKTWCFNANPDPSIIEIYCGQYINNKRHGIGFWRFPTGASFIGEFRDHIPKGFGIYTTWFGLKFIGEVEKNTAVKGKWYDQADNEIDIEELGYSFDGRLCLGQTTIWMDGLKYTGEWKNNKMHGQGTFINPDLSMYEGELKNDQRHGQGTWTWPDGSKYVGEYKDGYSHGHGIHTWADGRKFVGEWYKGNKNGQGTYIDEDGNKYVEEWEYGNIISHG